MVDIEILRQIPVFSTVPESRLKWLCEVGKEVWLEPGDLHRAQGALADCIFVMLEGEVRVFQQVGEQEVVLATYKAKELFGELPILTDEEYFWAAGRAVTHCHIFELPKEAFWELLSSCAKVTTKILSTMARRMQEVQTLSQQREKLAALGTLAAGLAHEMNNPASAVTRGARSLQSIWQELSNLALKLHQYNFSSAQIDFLSKLHHQLTQDSSCDSLDPLSRCDAEDTVSDWLDDHGVEDGWELAPTLVSADIDCDQLATIASQIPPQALGDVIKWLTVAVTGMELLSQVEQSSTRISDLVQAIKDYSYMDQAPLQAVDVHQGIESTLTILTKKLANVKLKRGYAENLPQISAYGSELNQVWTNLIVNAVEALEGQGQIQIKTCCEKDHVLVEITDDGPGIPPEIQPRIFEPFFTTKDVGHTGLGLDMAYRVVVIKHKGDMNFSSQPGTTSFRVRLPVMEAET